MPNRYSCTILHVVNDIKFSLEFQIKKRKHTQRQLELDVDGNFIYLGFLGIEQARLVIIRNV